MNFHILTLFPEMVMQGLQSSILGRAVENGAITIDALNIRDYTVDKHKKVDDYPYGGGAGMLMQAQPVFDAHKELLGKIEKKQVRTIYLSPQGKTFDQEMARELSKEEELIFLCGHYEGIDERVLEEVVTDYVSIGDFVLTGGELPAMVMIDAISRLVPGVLNNDMSAETESFHNYLLEYPQYSRPEEWNGKKVPEVLLSGDHKKIKNWRLEQSIARTKERRPDLYAEYEKLQNCKEQLLKDKLLHIDMIELINRGRGTLLYHDKEGSLLKDKESGVYMLTAKNEAAGKKLIELIPDENTLVVMHQAFLNKYLQDELGFKLCSACYQSVYTRKEPLPIDKSIDIRKLELSHAKQVSDSYHNGDEAYVISRIKKGCMFGSFIGDTLTGFAGVHEEGSVGMLHVFDEYRKKGIATALESFMINRELAAGNIPYGQVITDNTISLSLQSKLGQYFSKSEIYWFETR